MGWGQHEVAPSWVSCGAKLGGTGGSPKAGPAARGIFWGRFLGDAQPFNPPLPGREGLKKGNFGGFWSFWGSRFWGFFPQLGTRLGVFCGVPLILGCKILLPGVQNPLQPPFPLFFSALNPPKPPNFHPGLKTSTIFPPWDRFFFWGEVAFSPRRRMDGAIHGRVIYLLIL